MAEGDSQKDENTNAAASSGTSGLLELRFPTAGLVRRFGYQNQPPYTTCGAKNVRPFDTLEGRERGGSRPGLRRAYSNLVRPGYPLQLLNAVSWIDENGENRSTLIAAAGGRFYRCDDADGIFESSTAHVNPNIAQIQSAVVLQRLFFADYRDRRIYLTDATVAGNRITSPSISDWTEYEIDTAQEVVYVQGSNDAGEESYFWHITEVMPGYIQIERELSNGRRTVIVDRYIRHFDPRSGVEWHASTPQKGMFPFGCPLMCNYRNRLVCAGPDHMWYMSRQDDPFDWDYGANFKDLQRAVAGTSGSTGEVGEPITALIPHTDDTLLFGCAHSIWALRGDPTYGGQIDSLSREVGPISANAWCKMADGSILFLSRDGVYQVNPGGYNYPVAISRDRLPRDLVDVDATNNVVTMAFDTQARGVHLCVTPLNGTVGTQWWLDWETKSYWPFDVPAAMQPHVILSYAPDRAAERRTMYGGRDSGIRYFADGQLTDDGTPFGSYVDYGPIRLGVAGADGLLAELSVVLDEGSGPLYWEVFEGDTAELAAQGQAGARVTGALLAGRNRVAYPRVRAHAVNVRVASTQRWAIEGLALIIRAGGRLR